MAWEIPGFCPSGWVAAADLSAKQFYFVKLTTAGAIDVCSAVTDIPIGILQNKPALNQAAQVMMNGISKVICSADLARGNQVGTAADGRAAAYANGTDTTKYIVGQVIEDNSAPNGIATIAFSCLAPHRGA